MRIGALMLPDPPDPDTVQLNCIPTLHTFYSTTNKSTYYNINIYLDNNNSPYTNSLFLRVYIYYI